MASSPVMPVPGAFGPGPVRKPALPLLASLKEHKRASQPDVSDEEQQEKQETKVKKKVPKIKVKKGHPMEVSSRRPQMPLVPGKAGTKANACRDPRFDDLSGKLDVDLFQKSYAFLDEYRQQEIHDLKREAKLTQRQLRKRRSGALKAQIDEINQEVKSAQQQDKQRKRLAEFVDTSRELKKKERQKVRETGKMPYFHKPGAVRKILREQKSEGAKKRGGGRDKEEEKREKRKGQKEKKRMPKRRGVEAE